MAVAKHIQVRDRLRSAILAGEYREGEQLPAEQFIAQQHNVSLVTARRAVSDDVVDQLTVTGTPQECAAQLAAFDGVDDLALVNVNGMRYRVDPSPAGALVARGLLDSYQPLLQLGRTAKSFR